MTGLLPRQASQEAWSSREEKGFIFLASLNLAASAPPWLSARPCPKGAKGPDATTELKWLDAVAVQVEKGGLVFQALAWNPARRWADVADGVGRVLCSGCSERQRRAVLHL